MEHHADVDAYLAASELWPEEARALCEVLRGCGLEETIKWGKPTYVHDGANVLIVQEFKDFLALMFTKGALLDDPEGVLHSQGEHTRSALRMQFTSVEEVTSRAAVIADYVDRAVAVEDAGLEVGPAPEPDLPEELRERLASDPELSEAFDDLTPGRRRSWAIHIGDAKKPETRVSRVDKAVPRIRAGKGHNER
ncbi:YdeI family protein [Euzebya sp.]|uniref:YdeI/OmpD-associated family protein n=1 Tax=Euzebya sp. TaxID=1971409 RepID=UPI0035195B24